MQSSEFHFGRAPECLGEKRSSYYWVTKEHSDVELFCGITPLRARPTRTTTTPSSSLPAQLEQIGLHADFNWSSPTKIERDIIERALTLDFLPEARNLILMGTNGLGKTDRAEHLPCGGAGGHSVLFRSAASLLEEFHRQTPEGRQRKLRAYGNVGLLCVDEVGYLSFDDKSADLLYEVINRRYERKPVILTTNRPFKEWNEVFPNAACIVTLLDRLLHHAEVTKIEGDSYRVRESEQETAARRRKKMTPAGSTVAPGLQPGVVRLFGADALCRSAGHPSARQCFRSMARPPSL